MMTFLMQIYPGERGLEFLLAVILVASVASSVAWLIAWGLRRHAALRDLVLFCGLLCCLVSPILVGAYTAAGVTLVAIPLFDVEQTSPPENEDSQRQNRVVFGQTHWEGAAEKISSCELPVPSTLRPNRTVNECRTITESEVEEQADCDARLVDFRCPEVTSESLPSATEMGSNANVPAEVDIPKGHARWRGFAMGAILVWSAGTLATLLWLGWNCGRVIRLRRSADLIPAERLSSVALQIAESLQLGRVPALLISNRIVAPLAVGFGRPAVILPRFLLEKIADRELQDILVHEFTHLRRGDQWRVLLQELVGGLYWPILTVHGLNRELQRAGEEVCDNVVLSFAGGDTIGYGRTLLRIAEFLVQERPMRAAVGIVGGRGELERRIAGLIDPRRNRTMTIGRKAAGVVLVLFFSIGMVVSPTRFCTSARAVEPETPEVCNSTEALGAAADAAPSSSDPPKGAQARGASLPPLSDEELKPSTIDLERKIVLDGTVLDSTNRPVAGAKLFVSVDSWADPVELASTNDKGEYRIVAPEKVFRRYMDGTHTPELKVTLIAVAEGFGPEWITLPADRQEYWQAMKPAYVHDFRLTPDLPIWGRVVDSAGRPVARAKIEVDSLVPLTDPNWEPLVSAIQAGDPHSLERNVSDPALWKRNLFRTAWKSIPSTTTDDEGQFRMTTVGRNRAVKLNLSGPGIRPLAIGVLTRDDVAEFTQAIRDRYPRTRNEHGYFHLPRKDTQEGDVGILLFGPRVTVEVDPARTIAGVVRDAGTGKPLAHVRVTNSHGMSDYTDHRGQYRILRGDDARAVTVFASPIDFDRYPSVARRFEGTGELGEMVADFDLPPGVVISGRVLEAGTGRPIVSGARRTCHAPWPGTVVAGLVSYYPLSHNDLIRESPTGLYFAAGGRSASNYHISAWIDSAGRFQIAVPPGPGVLLVRSAPGIPDFAGWGHWKESTGFHRLFPYTLLRGRRPDDGAPAGDPLTLPGINGPIPLENFHAYQVINPEADTKTVDLTLTMPRAPSRRVRFVDPDGREMQGVRVKGALAPPYTMTVLLDGAEVELLAVEADQPREVLAISDDGKFTARAVIGVDDPELTTVRLSACGAILGRLVDDATGLPLTDFRALFSSPERKDHIPPLIVGEVTSAGDGRFKVGTLIPGVATSIAFQEPHRSFTEPRIYAPEALKSLVVRSGEVRDLGEVRIRVPSAEDAPAK